MTAASPAAGFVVALSLALVGAAPRPHPPAAQDPRVVATLAGRVLSTEGELLDGLRIALTSLDHVVIHQTSTDPDGGFTFAAIRSGQYYVVVLRDGYTYPLGRVGLLAGQTLERAFRKGIEISGTVIDERGAPVAGAPVCALQRQAFDRPRYAPRMWTETDAKGRFVLGPGTVNAERGVYVAAVMPSGCDVKLQQPSARLASYPTTYAPGVPAVAEATELVLDARTPALASIRLRPGPTTRIEGRLMGYQNTTVVPGQVILRPPDDAVSIARTARIEKDGRFVIPGLAKGTYRLLVPPRRGPDPLMWADESVTVIGEPVRRLAIRLQPTLAIGGEFSFRGRPAMLYDTRTFLTINAEFIADRSDVRDLWPLAWTSVLPDGKFAITGLVPGRYRISVSGAEPWGWRPSSALYRGAPDEGARLEPIDLFDAPITLAPGQNVFGVQIEMTNLTTTVSGRVVDADDQPVTRAAVAVFSADPRYWTPGSRRYRFVLSGADGGFTIQGLPEGDYLIVSSPSLQPASNPQALDALRTRAVAFSLTDGDTRELVLRSGGM